MMRSMVRALRATVVLAVITGLFYPVAMTLFAQGVFHSKAEGTLVRSNGQVIGSSLIGQRWEGPQWFYGRPSAIEYDASTSGGTNLGPTSKKLADEISARAKAIAAIESPYQPGLTTAQIPVDLVTASASGLDPHISPAAAGFQAPRIAAVRHLSIDAVRALIRAHTEGRTLGILGMPRVNVLELNFALEQNGAP